MNIEQISNKLDEINVGIMALNNIEILYSLSLDGMSVATEEYLSDILSESLDEVDEKANKLYFLEIIIETAFNMLRSKDKFDRDKSEEGFVIGKIYTYKIVFAATDLLKGLLK